MDAEVGALSPDAEKLVIAHPKVGYRVAGAVWWSIFLAVIFFGIGVVLRNPQTGWLLPLVAVLGGVSIASVVARAFAWTEFEFQAGAVRMRRFFARKLLWEKTCGSADIEQLDCQLIVSTKFAAERRVVLFLRDGSWQEVACSSDFEYANGVRRAIEERLGCAIVYRVVGRLGTTAEAW